MKKIFIAFGKAVFGAAKIVLAVIRRKWGTPDEQECAAQFITMIDRGEIPHPPRRGKTIGSIRPTLKSNI